jgi:hypothetical protein
MTRSAKRQCPLAFGEYFEQKFRRSPVVIGLGLIVGGFTAGFGAHSALTKEQITDPSPSTEVLEHCLSSVDKLLHHCDQG